MPYSYCLLLIMNGLSSFVFRVLEQDERVSGCLHPSFALGRRGHCFVAAVARSPSPAIGTFTQLFGVLAGQRTCLYS